MNSTATHHVEQLLKTNPHREFTVPEIASLAHQPKARVNGILETLAGKGTELHVRTVHGLPLVSFGGRLSFAEEERNRRLERERLKAEEAKREAEEEKSMRVERIEKGRMQAEKIRIMAAPSPNWFDALATPAAPVRDDGEMQAAVARVSQLAEKDLHEKETMVAVIDMIDREEFDRAERALAAYKAQIMSKAELIAEAIAQVRMAKEREVFQWTGG